MQQHSQEQQLQFKRKKQAYIAQRRAHKKEAQKIIKKKFGKSSSHSSESDEPQKNNIFIIKANKQFENYNTNSSNSVEDMDLKIKDLRQKRQQERLKHKKQALLNKRKQFGSSSSDDEPISKIPNIKIVQTSLKNIQQPPSERKPTSKSQNTITKELKPNQLSSVKLKSQNGDKKILREKFQIEIPSKKGVNLWIEKELQLKQNCFQFGDRNVPIYDISKIKLLMEETHSGKKKMKISLKDEQIFIAASHNKFAESQYLDHYYFIFAKIITLKLNLMGRKSNPSQKYQNIKVEEKYLKDSRIAGKIRKSSFFGGWQQKICVINNKGLSLYKQGKQKPSLFIGMGSIKQLWTRLQFQGENLIVKCLNGTSKIELSIPNENFLSRDNWLYQIYNLTAK